MPAIDTVLLFVAAAPESLPLRAANLWFSDGATACDDARLFRLGLHVHLTLEAPILFLCPVVSAKHMEKWLKRDRAVSSLRTHGF